MPGENDWIVMLNKETELWGAGNYNKEDEVASFKVKSKKLPILPNLLRLILTPFQPLAL